MEGKNNRNRIIIHIILSGIVLWGFYIVQEEFANYGMYQLVSYPVHEISSVIPLACILVTIVIAAYLTWRLLKRKSDKADKILLAVMVLCFCVQVGYFRIQADMVYTAAVCTIDEVYEAEERIIVTIEGRAEKLELKSPMLVNGLLVEKEQKYLIDFVWDMNRPNEGELHMISLVD